MDNKIGEYHKNIYAKVSFIKQDGNKLLVQKYKKKYQEILILLWFVESKKTNWWIIN